MLHLLYCLVLLLLLLHVDTAASLRPTSCLQLLPLLLQLLLELCSACRCLMQCCCNASWRIRLAVHKPAGGYKTDRMHTVIQ
jgi:hypothetical protein